MDKDSFGTYHPIICFGYFCAVIILSMIYLHPALLLFSFFGSLFYGIYLGEKKAAKFFCCLPLPVILISMVMNPLFNHRGATILFYFRDNPVTVEAMIYGLVSGLMFASVIMWFYCYNHVMTSDKFMYIFGKAAPASSLVFSMVLRFIPRYHRQTKTVSQGQTCMGRGVGNGSFRQKIKHGAAILGIMTTWAFENAIDTADSMKARGYGLKGRSHFSIYKREGRDLAAGIFVAAALAAVIAGGFAGYNTPDYYPVIYIPRAGVPGTINYICYFCLCFLPIGLDIKEDIKWRYLRSRI